MQVSVLAFRGEVGTLQCFHCLRLLYPLFIVPWGLDTTSISRAFRLKQGSEEEKSMHAASLHPNESIPRKQYTKGSYVKDFKALLFWVLLKTFWCEVWQTWQKAFVETLAITANQIWVSIVISSTRQNRRVTFLQMYVMTKATFVQHQIYELL